MLRGFILFSFLLVANVFAAMEVEPNGSFTKAQEIYNYDTVYATINRNSSDYDYYKFQVAGQAFNFSFQTNEENMDYYITIYNQQQKKVEYYHVNKGQRGFNITLGITSGTAYIKVSASNYTGSDGAYSVTVSGLGAGEILQNYEIEPNDSFTTANEIYPGTYYHGYISKNNSDYDFYKFTNYNDSINLVFDTEEENIDHYIYVNDQQHNQVKYFHLSKGELHLNETFGIAQGTVYVKVSAGNYTDSFGAYQIAVDPYSPSPVSPTPAPIPAPAPQQCNVGMIDEDDMQQDWLSAGCSSKVRSGSYAKNYQININRNVNVYVSLSSDDFDTYLSLYDMNGNLIASNDDSGGGTNSELEIPLNAGSYIVEASSYYPNETGTFYLLYSLEEDVISSPVPVSPSPSTFYYGAIAYDRYTGYWATGWRYSDRTSAEQSTLQTCGSAGCEIVADVSGNECASLAVDTYSGAYEIAFGTTRGEAEASALMVCEIFHNNCQIDTSVCADGR